MPPAMRFEYPVANQCFGNDSQSNGRANPKHQIPTTNMNRILREHLGFPHFWLFAFILIMTMTQSLKAQPFFKAAAVAKGSITLAGNLTIDSFDSSNPTYSTNGKYDIFKRKDGGHIATIVSNMVNAVTVGESVRVYGKIYTGQFDTIQMLGSGTAGSINWIDSGSIGIEPGWLTTTPPLYIYDAPPPPTTGLPLPPKGPNLFQGTNHSNSYLLANGNYVVGGNFTLSVTDKILILGNVKLFFAANFAMSGQSQIFIGTNSSLTIYAGGSLNIGGSGIANPNSITNCVIYGQSGCTSIALGAVQSLLSNIYAPYANFTFNGGGAITSVLYGSVMANSLTFSGKTALHYDEAIPGYVIQPSKAAYLWFPPHFVYQPNNGDFRFRVSSPYQLNYAVETSTNLIDWTSVVTNTVPFDFTNSGYIGTQQFFRAVLIP